MAEAARASAPELGSLAKLLEADVTVRRRMREQGHMSRWPSIHTVGIPSCKGMACNARILEIIAEWWCPSQVSPVIVPIEVMRAEAGMQWGLHQLAELQEFLPNSVDRISVCVVRQANLLR